MKKISCNTVSECQVSRNTKEIGLLSGNSMRTYWFFTWNNYNKNNIVQLCTYFLKYTFQEETGENGTPHLQGVVIKRCRFNTLKKHFPKVHWEPCRNIKAARNYCTKLETRTGKIFTKGMKKKVHDYFEGKIPFEWQKKILALIETEPDDRSIYWYWEPDGCSGKSCLTRHILLKGNSIAVSGNARDIKCGISEWMKNDKELRTVIIDIPRSSFSKISYKAIEELKNGFFYSTKYESKMCIFNIPHVIVFCNFEPEYEKLSKDRLRVTKIY